MSCHLVASFDEVAAEIVAVCKVLVVVAVACPEGGHGVAAVEVAAVGEALVPVVLAFAGACVGLAAWPV